MIVVMLTLAIITCVNITLLGEKIRKDHENTLYGEDKPTASRVSRGDRIYPLNLKMQA